MAAIDPQIIVDACNRRIAEIHSTIASLNKELAAVIAQRNTVPGQQRLAQPAVAAPVVPGSLADMTIDDIADEQRALIEALDTTLPGDDYE